MSIIMSMTWKEMLRKRVMLLTLIMTFVFLGAFWFVAGTIGGRGMHQGNALARGEQLLVDFANGSIILSLGFFFGSFVLAFLAIFSSFSAISGEAEQGIMQALLPRPLPRWKWYLGRWLGYVTLGVLYALLLFIAILLITESHASIPGDPQAWFTSFLLFASTVPLLITISMLGSGFFTALGNGVFMTMLYGAGWLGSMIDKLSSSLNLETEALNSLQMLTGLISLLIPADGLQRRMLAELFSLDDMGNLINTMGTSMFRLNDFSNLPSNSFVIYAAVYMIVLFLVGMLRFQRKDL
ncbi:ABC transporter permease subunit [Paenibacillus albidus]|uniref:ABC transporter permease n=1 Tax=Paenibacillus albidus TaxID=2041023 RepID=UPI001BE65A31|nr:ABC transporter permease subunit [Paenibacillus albidus]MBT2290911.1 ABC transporter permease subunit [Paenibacillus albidus]